MRLSVLISLFLVITNWSNAQSNEAYTDTIYFMNGDVYQCEILDASQIDVIFEYTHKKKPKTLEVHKSEIFAIVIDGEKFIYYEKNDFIGDELTIKEVEAYMLGQRDGRDNYNTVPVFLLGLGLSFGTSFAGEAGLLALTTPIIIYPIAQYIPVIKIRENTISNPDYQYNTVYAEGYERVVRGKRVMTALKSTGLGSVLGFISFQLLKR